MFVQQAFVYLAAAGLASASFVAVRAPLGVLDARSIQQGWSLQAGSAPAGATSCGGGSYCPSSLKCNPAATAEVAACCSGTDCRGDIEGAPVCADSSWSLWKGYNGNGFCCTTDQVGQYDSTKQVAGSCVAAVVAGATSAVIMSTGSGGSAQTSAPASTATTTAAAGTTTAAAAGTTGTASTTSASSSSATATTSGASSAAAVASSSANSTGTATAAPKATNGAERLASGFGVLVLAAGAMLAL